MFHDHHHHERQGPEFAVKLFEMVTRGGPLIHFTDGEITIEDPARLAREVLPLHFRHAKFSSLQRQLNNFSFKKIKGKGKMAACVYLREDLRGKPASALQYIRRKPAAGEGSNDKPPGESLCAPSAYLYGATRAGSARVATAQARAVSGDSGGRAAAKRQRVSAGGAPAAYASKAPALATVNSLLVAEESLMPLSGAGDPVGFSPGLSGLSPSLWFSPGTSIMGLDEATVPGGEFGLPPTLALAAAAVPAVPALPTDLMHAAAAVAIAAGRPGKQLPRGAYAAAAPPAPAPAPVPPAVPAAQDPASRSVPRSESSGSETSSPLDPHVGAVRATIFGRLFELKTAPP